MESLLERYERAMKRIGMDTLVNLPEEAKQVLKETTDLDTKIKMLELIACIAK